MIPATVQIAVWRNARYAEEFEFKIDGEPYDLTGWAGSLQVRLYGAQPGSAVITLANVGSNIEGVWINDPTLGCLQVRIDEATIAAAWTAIGGGAEAGEAARLKYDLVMTPPGGGDEVWIQGDFIIEPGVTV